MEKTTVLLIGDTSRAEFQEARATLAATSQLVEARDTATAGALLARGQVVPELIVLAQAYPGQFSEAEVKRLWRLAPLGRVIGLLGSWCEGESRSGRPWPGGIRLYWHQWPARWHQ